MGNNINIRRSIKRYKYGLVEPLKPLKIEIIEEKKDFEDDIIITYDKIVKEKKENRSHKFIDKFLSLFSQEISIKVDFPSFTIFILISFYFLIQILFLFFYKDFNKILWGPENLYFSNWNGSLYQGPLYQIIVSIFSNNILFLRIFGIIISSITIFILYNIVKKHFPKSIISYISLLLIVLNPYFIFFNTRIMNWAITGMFFVFLNYLLLILIKRKKENKKISFQLFLLLSIVSAFSLITSYLLIVPVIVILFLGFKLFSKFQKTFIVIILLLILIPVYIYNCSKGDPQNIISADIYAEIYANFSYERNPVSPIYKTAYDISSINSTALSETTRSLLKTIEQKKVSDIFVIYMQRIINFFSGKEIYPYIDLFKFFSNNLIFRFLFFNINNFIYIPFGLLLPISWFGFCFKNSNSNYLKVFLMATLFFGLLTVQIAELKYIFLPYLYTFSIYGIFKLLKNIKKYPFIIIVFLMLIGVSNTVSYSNVENNYNNIIISEIYLSKNEDDKAWLILNKIKQLYPNLKGIEYYIGNIAYKHGNLPLAIDNLRNISKTFPYDLDIYELINKVWYDSFKRSKDFVAAESVEYYSNILLFTYKTSNDNKFYLAEVYNYFQEWQKASSLYSEIVDDSLYNEEVINKLINIYINQGNLSAALIIIDKNLYYNYSDSLIEKKIILMLKLNKIEELKSFVKTLKGINLENAKVDLASYYYNIENYSASYLMIKQININLIEDAEKCMKICEIAFNIPDFNLTRQCLNRIIEINPRYLPEYNSNGDIVYLLAQMQYNRNIPRGIVRENIFLACQNTEDSEIIIGAVMLLKKINERENSLLILNEFLDNKCKNYDDSLVIISYINSI